jgi:hypothetical protein
MGIGRGRSNHSVEIALIDNVGIEECKSANAKMSELLDNVRTATTEADNADPYLGDGTLSSLSQE